MLCEKDDLGNHTSSASTKLIHGGLRYLELLDFALVRHALTEREVLLRAAPHIIWPLRFILPHHRELRPRWLIRLGLFLYDHLGGRKRLPASNAVDLTKHLAGAPLKDEFTHAFEYSDCWVQDSRLVSLSVLDAHERGCDVRVRTEVTDMKRATGCWQVGLFDHLTGKASTVQARAIVNASGPWVVRTLDLDAEHDVRHGVRLVRGSHIVVPKIFDHDYAYIFQNADGRIIFAIPYESDFTLIGTTDVDVDGEPGPAGISDEEIRYLCDAAGRYFRKPIGRDDVVWDYSGIRPLYDDASNSASKVTRDYKLDLDTRDGAPVLSVYGGKITTFRKLAEESVDMLGKELGIRDGDWTETAPLPGGDFADADFGAFLAAMRERYPWMDAALLHDYCRNYGTRIERLVGEARSMDGLGEHFGGHLYAAEVRYLIAEEWARAADDILWRRSRKGLHVPPGTGGKLDAWISERYDFGVARPHRPEGTPS